MLRRGQGRLATSRTLRLAEPRSEKSGTPPVDKFFAVTSVVVGVVLALLLTVVLMVPTGPQAESPVPTDGIADIPSLLVPIYAAAARACPGLSWTVLAAIGKVESDHGRSSGSAIQADGRVEPPIIGVALDGTGGNTTIRDTDGGFWDTDRLWDRAVGPLQFIPSTWRSQGADGNGDGLVDPHNFADAALAAAGYLCSAGAGDPATLRAAVLAYNHASWYVEKVLAQARIYENAASSPVPVAGGYALPVASEFLTLELLRRPHHDYPAWDLAVPVGTPAYAVAGGTILGVTSDGRCGTGVIVDGLDGYRYTYCHGSAVMTRPGATVAAGAIILLSGNSGRSTGPHLHLQIEGPDSSLICPHVLLESLYVGRPPTLTAGYTGCVA